jgi:Family of unknown function (DUF5989)
MDTFMNDFEEASRNARGSLFGDLWSFLQHSKKWWLLPLIVVFVMFSMLLVLSSTAAAPFIYTLF